jgi:hypothetical protein
MKHAYREERLEMLILYFWTWDLWLQREYAKSASPGSYIKLSGALEGVEFSVSPYITVAYICHFKIPQYLRL